MTAIQKDVSILHDADGLTAQGCTRRDFMRTACASAVLASLGVTLSACDSNEPGSGGGGGGGSTEGITVTDTTITMDLTKPGAAALRNAGGFVLVSSAQAIVARVDASTIRAFYNACPHQGFPITTFSGGRFLCSQRGNDHGSQFNTEGERVAGPAPSGLTEFSVSRPDENTVVVSLI